MTPQMLPFLALCVDIALVLILLSFAVAFVRIALGPTLPDRVVAFDMLALLAVGFIGLLTLRSGHPVFLDAAIALALVAFVGTVAYARYIERCGVRQEGG
ncbi:MAG TPA: cation:proton antiporter [Myxococcota bacterium]|jgi:multicomponent Na+:H+ antiporter subunit F|nr:cation:proton antiporter [Myxococcota bacterium]